MTKSNPTCERRHYEFVAAAVAEMARLFDNQPLSANYVAAVLADHFAGDNPRFDRARFLRACGVDD